MPAIRRIHIASDTAAIIARTRFAKKQLTRACIMQIIAIRLFFVNLPNFKTHIIRVQIAKVDSVSMTFTRTVHELAIMINRATAFDNFIKSITIDISRRNIMVTLSIAFLTARRRIVIPALLQVFSVPIISGNRHARVITSLENHARLFAIKVSVRREESIHAIAVIIAPALDRTAARIVIDRRHFEARFTVKNREVFVTRQNVSV